jgi:hypothetical protein
MRIMTVTAVALAAIAGTPAFAANAPSVESVRSGSAVLDIPTYAGKHRAEDGVLNADQAWAANAPSNWSAPWDAKPAPLLSILDNAVINILPWQVCGSTAVAGVGGAVPVNSPNTVLGSCNNANTQH